MMKTVSGVTMLALFLIGVLAFSFNVQVVGAEGSWVWVRDTVTGAYGEAVVGTGTALYIARGTKFYRYTPSDNSFVELAERLRANPGEVIEALKNLRQDNIIYLYRSDISGYWKVGLKRGFLRVLEEDLKAKH